MENSIIDLKNIKSKQDDIVNESASTFSLSKDKQLAGYFHKGFWYAMDTLRDQIYLDSLWNKSKAPWKTWKD